jgi:hypothetical protein
MSKYLKILTEEKERILNLHKKRFLYELNPNKWGKQLNEEGEIKRPDEDPFAYMKSGDTYYHINLGKEDKSIPLETDSRWKEETRPKAIEAIKTEIFSADTTTTTTGTGTTPETTTTLSPKEQEIWNNSLIDSVKKITSDTKWNKFPCVPLSYNKTGGDTTRINTTYDVPGGYKNVIFIKGGVMYLNDGTYCKDEGYYECGEGSKKFTCNKSDIVKS